MGVSLDGIHAMHVFRGGSTSKIVWIAQEGKRLNLLQFVSYLPLLVSNLLHLHATPHTQHKHQQVE